MEIVYTVLLFINAWVLTHGLDCIRNSGYCRYISTYGDINDYQPKTFDYIESVDLQSEARRERDPGSIVRVTVESTVGVNLDEFSTDPKTLNRIVRKLRAQKKQFWIDRASKQILLSTFRFIFRPLFIDGKFQLPLTQPDHWKFVIHGNATRDRSIDGHDIIYVRYTWVTYLLSDFDSPGISEPRLGKIGGRWNEPFVLPVDPYNIIQRTGFACMDEGSFPVPSVNPEKTEWFYDDTCDVEPPFIYSPYVACVDCHCSHNVTISCVRALKEHIGSVKVLFLFERLPWNQAQADRIRSSSDPPSTKHPQAADQVLLISGLASTLVEYKYFDNHSCEFHEPCIGATGWRRLLMFDSSDENVGGIDLTIGQIYTQTDNLTQLPAEVTNHGLYQYDTCHRHYHFKYYGTFTFEDTPYQNAKRGFCIQSTGRQANAEFSPLWSLYYNCTYQGNSPGWTDTYQAGIPCQWIDVTDFKTGSSSVTGSLNADMNPNDMLCEGKLVLNKTGGFIWEPTNFTAMNGETVYRPKCRTGENPSTLANNIDKTKVTLPMDGNGYVTAPCSPAGQHIGSQRNCGFTMKASTNACTPGKKTNLRCSLKSTTPSSKTVVSQVVRICESSSVLNTGTACDYDTALGNAIVVSSSSISIGFECPSYRDPNEQGGLYSIYSAPIMEQLDDGHTDVECELIQ